MFDNKDFSSDHKPQRLNIYNVDTEEPIDITEEQVINVFNKISTRNAAGPDKIFPKTMKNCLSNLHNIFILSQPSKCHPLGKISELILINKKPLPLVDNELLPLAFTVILSKCFECMMLPTNVSCHTYYRQFPVCLPP